VIGRLLDKYEILEEVGQGGMAVVYKGLDTSLHREVAIKVLHPHLAGHEEARRRFEREAQAVAKLRHENILEIFDYSGKQSAESYIVTEFIKGGTLKDFVTRHKLAYPEVGAMVVVEVCRALQHAHSLGVLHRDIKPENIMVRDDGVVKLMDFGIAQIVDAQRMTVTGQLLGSPAYMSPEHVEGKPLDFRTDVFSVGILLYQLSTGELPFKGRNPHEILKRIAECKFVDARVVNPFVGDRLGKIIAGALSREPADRYQDVSQLLEDLQRYLSEAELEEPRKELGRFFAQPVPYEQALRTRLIASLSKKGKAELAARRTPQALELFNRVLTIDPTNEEVLKDIDRLSRRRRMTRAMGLAAGVAVIGGAVLAVVQPWRQPAAAETPDAATVVVVTTPDGATVAELPPDATAVVAAPVDAGRIVVTRPRHDAAVASVKPDAAPSAAQSYKLAPLGTVRGNWKYQIDDGPKSVLPGAGLTVTLAGSHSVTFTHPYCKTQTVPLLASTVANCECKPASVTPVCSAATRAMVEDRGTNPGQSVEVQLDSQCRADVRVDFVLPDGVKSVEHVSIVAGEDKKVPCPAD
jgi:serine/threonine protein kinase